MSTFPTGAGGGGGCVVPSNLRRSKKQDKRGVEIGKNLDSLGAVLRDYVRIAL